MLARNFSPRIKGRVITWGGVLGSVGGIAAGIIVGEILGDTNIPFPLNYGIVITVANVLFFLSFSMILLNREVPGNPKAHEEKRDVSYLKHIKDLIATDPRLRKAILVRVLANVEQMAAAFYVVYARESLKLPESAIGIFTVAVVAGGILGTTIFGWVYNRFGALRVINSASTLQFLAPLMAFLVSFIAVPGTFWAYIAYGVMFVVMMINGALGRSNILGYMSYVQESASEANRSAYLGALNTIAGIIALMPVVGGVIIDALTGAGWGFMAYTVVFGLCTLVSGLGTWRGFHLPKLTNRDTRL
jgi:predicted MFS family arabinose efflux permease